ncbi:hypothetical protein PGT21_032079 [Puccinia graminis f. sp. tritici]|uniref:Retrotransposon gag domain-containing protein n=1 Tax=Puccinia graminis f. sp. tritici TaxID=56615 RepID=A0A5B0Q753_PUCGR|nr:hypothetical protein PGT21_032079 [Puccinia graminis f. sp. tritici]
MSILKENARTQELPTQFASAEDPYVIPCLHSIRTFLAKLEETFADRNSVEDAKHALYSCKQGNMSLDVFNSLFSSLVYAVDLTEESRCDLYKRALNPRILEITIVKDSWKTANTLRKKQDLAVLASNILNELNQLRNNMAIRQPNHRPSAPPPPPVPTATPMDIDAITASTGFTFPLYRAICVKNKLCQHCHKAYNSAHISNLSCPNVEVSMKDKFDLLSRLSQEQPAPQISNINVSAVNFNFNPPVQSWDHLGHHSVADLLMFGCDSEGNPLQDGLPWLKANKAWVGGPNGQLLFSSLLFCNAVSSALAPSPVVPSLANNPSLLNQDKVLSLPSPLRSYSDVFTVASLQSLPPV